MTLEFTSSNRILWFVGTCGWLTSQILVLRKQVEMILPSEFSQSSWRGKKQSWRTRKLNSLKGMPDPGHSSLYWAHRHEQEQPSNIATGCCHLYSSYLELCNYSRKQKSPCFRQVFYFLLYSEPSLVAYVAWGMQVGCLTVLDIQWTGGWVVSILGNTMTSLKTLVQLGLMTHVCDLRVGEVEVGQSEGQH